jgi:hypothetical protein
MQRRAVRDALRKVGQIARGPSYRDQDDIALERMGLDPTLGLMHSDKRHRASPASEVTEAAPVTIIGILVVILPVLLALYIVRRVTWRRDGPKTAAPPAQNSPSTVIVAPRLDSPPSA